MAVLGAIIIEKTAIEEVIDLLDEDSFYPPAHKAIFGAIMNLHQSNSSIDLVTVVKQLRKEGTLDIAGGPYGVTKLTNMVVGSTHIVDHAKIIHECWLRRKQADIGRHLINLGHSDESDPFDTNDFIDRSLTELNRKTNRGKQVDLSDLAIEELNRFKKIEEGGGGLIGIDTSLLALNMITNGWQAPDFIIVAARPSVGKTSLSTQFATTAAKNGLPTLFFSLEMSASQLYQRILSSEAELPLDWIKTASLSKWNREKYVQAQNRLAKLPLFIDDTPALTIAELKSIVRKRVRKDKIGLVVIDYLQLMQGVRDRYTNREQEVSGVSRSIKALAKELNIPIIALCQLSREGEKNKPTLATLRESGAIEQDADIVMFITRPDYQGQKNEFGEVERTANIIIAKHRNGETAELTFNTNLRIQKWLDKDQEVKLFTPYDEDFLL